MASTQWSSHRTLWMAFVLLLVSVASGRMMHREDRGDDDARRFKSTCQLSFKGRPVGGARQDSKAAFDRVSSLLARYASGTRLFCVELAGEPFQVHFVEPADEGFRGRALAGTRTVEVSTLFATGAPDSVLNAVVIHELVHLALAEVVARRPIPSWYSEGVAHSLAGTVTCEDSLFFTLNVELAVAAGGDAELGARRALQLLGEDDRAATAMVFSKLAAHIDHAGLQSFHETVRSQGFYSAVQGISGQPVSDLLRTWAESTSREISRHGGMHVCGAG